MRVWKKPWNCVNTSGGPTYSHCLGYRIAGPDGHGLCQHVYGTLPDIFSGGGPKQCPLWAPLGEVCSAMLRSLSGTARRANTHNLHRSQRNPKIDPSTHTHNARERNPTRAHGKPTQTGYYAPEPTDIALWQCKQGSVEPHPQGSQGPWSLPRIFKNTVSYTHLTLPTKA